MTAILCFGDSNTWGYAASTPERLGRWDRWPGVLQRELGDDVHVIEEGLSGRTTVFEDPFQPYRNGLAHLPVSLLTHAPLEAVVISLGTNDLFVPGVNSFLAACGAMKLAEVTLASGSGPSGGAPVVLVVIPPPLASLGAGDAASPNAKDESGRFGEAYRRVALDYSDVHLLDLGEHVTSSPLDGVHFEAADHRKIGIAVATRIRELLDL